MPPPLTAYGYIRVSTGKQVESGLSLESQRQAVTRYHQYSLADYTLGEIFTERGVSAFRHPLARRPEGSRLEATLRPSDQVIIPKLDRAFRSLIDFAPTLARWHRREIGIHLLDLGVDTTTSSGKLVASIMASIAEWESQCIGERIRAAVEVRRAQGKATNGTPPIGWHKTPERMIVPDAGERSIGDRIIELREIGGTWKEVAVWLNADETPTRQGIAWSDGSANRWYAAAIKDYPLSPGH